MKIAIGEIHQETDTFTPTLTGIEAFKSYGLYKGEEILTELRGVGPLGGFIEVVESRAIEIEIVPLVRAWAGAGSTIRDTTFNKLLKMLLDPLKCAGPLDGVFLSLHGAACMESDDDLDAVVLEAVRTVIGNDVPLVCTLDHHANISTRMVNSADMLIGHETQPHDTFSTGVKAAGLLFDWIIDEKKPAISWAKIPMITPQDHFLTSVEPMKELFDRARLLEKREDVMAVSPFPMQPWLDVAEAGWSIVVHTVSNYELANRLANEMAELAWSKRYAFWKSDRVSIKESVRRAYAAKQGMVILSDTGDAVYGGAPGDNTSLLKELIEQSNNHEDRVMLVPVVDASVVAASFETGIGRSLSVSIGGKMDNIFCSPVDIDAEIIANSNNNEVDVGERGKVESGRTSLLKVGSVYIAVMDQANFVINYPELYKNLGIDLKKATAVVLKTGSNFQYFDHWRKGLIRVDSPGMTQSNLKKFTWKKIPRPIFPLDRDELC